MLKSFPSLHFLTLLTSALCPCLALADGKSPVIESAQNGSWSAKTTWKGGKVPTTGDRVLIRRTHRVVYDVQSDKVIRAVNIAGSLIFATDRNTRLDVGLIKIQPSDEFSEEGFDCEAHVTRPDPNQPRSTLQVGSTEKPLDAKYTAVIRLHHVKGLDPQSCPAIVCCGGRMDFHGSPMSRTWVKLGADAKAGDATVTLGESVTGWRVGDRVLLTATKKVGSESGTRRPGVNNRKSMTEERTIRRIDGTKVTLDQALSVDHSGKGEFKGEIANLSRNVIVESADPKGIRGHTMYHAHSAGAISYAEFRHLGKENILGRYAIHFHLVRDSMRGSYVQGASIWDSHNRWITIHGTDYLIVRDCVGYQSVGHGFFLEDGTEVYNVLDRNLAVQSFRGKRLPKQVLPFDANDGAGFWWANSLNTFTRNVSCENDRYGYRFEATPSSRLKVTFPVRQPDGEQKPTDIRTLPFVRFEDNEAHCDGLYGFNLGEGVNRVGPDVRHPFVIRRMKIWEIHYAFRVQSPCVLVEDMTIHRSVYGVYHPNYDHHVYRNLRINGDASEPFNRGHDDLGVQYGPLSVDGLTFEGVRGYPTSIPLIQLSANNPTGKAVSHFRNVKVVRQDAKNRRPVLDTGGGAEVEPETPTGVTVFLHDYYGSGRHARVMASNAKDFGRDNLSYRSEQPLTGHQARVAEVKNVEFPKLLDPIDDLPPTTVITQVLAQSGGKFLVRGYTADNGSIKKVIVNGQEMKPSKDALGEWEIILNTLPSGSKSIRAHAVDVAGNVEKTGHTVFVP